MIARTTIGIVLALAAIAEIAFPGNSAYHAGWFNVTVIALLILLAWRVPPRAIVPVVGMSIVAFATVVSGLLGPDDQTVLAAPGQQVNLGAAGALDFPHDVKMPVIEGRAYRAAFALEPVPHTIVRVEANDQRGGSLTITQPTGEAFLSPYLLMNSTQTISGMTLPFDSFSVPALHRMIKAVLFSPRDAARVPSLAPGFNVLFDVQDDSERQIPGGLGVVADGQAKTIGGVQLTATVANYPGVRVVSMPDLRFVVAGLLIAIVGLLPLVLPRTPSRS